MEVSFLDVMRPKRVVTQVKPLYNCVVATNDPGDLVTGHQYPVPQCLAWSERSPPDI